MSKKETLIEKLAMIMADKRPHMNIDRNRMKKMNMKNIQHEINRFENMAYARPATNSPYMAEFHANK